MEEIIKALGKHELRLRRFEAHLLSQEWPTAPLRKKGLTLVKDVRETIDTIKALREGLEEIAKEG